jgi:acyl-CoA thioesterase
VIDPTLPAEDVWQFDRETAIAPTETPGVWSTQVSGAWNIGLNPNGGYGISSIVRALAASVPHPMPMSVTSHYLRPPLSDQPARIVTETIRVGRTTSTVTGHLVQEGKERIRVLASFGDPPAPEATTLATIPPFEVPEPDECHHRRDLEQGVELPILSRLDVRIDPALSGVSGRAELAGWIRFADGRPPDLRSLILFCDAFPPSPFGLLGRVGWVPTLELTVHVRRPPAAGWIRAHLRTRDLHDQVLVEDCVLWDSTDAVVAQARQLSLLRVER